MSKNLREGSYQHFVEIKNILKIKEYDCHGRGRYRGRCPSDPDRNGPTQVGRHR